MLLQKSRKCSNSSATQKEQNKLFHTNKNSKGGGIIAHQKVDLRVYHSISPDENANKVLKKLQDELRED